MKHTMRWMTTLRSLLESQGGSALPLIGMGIMVLVGSTGIAVDMGRVQVAQSRMSSALDAAGLAAGANVNSVNINAEVNKYFYANFPVGYMGSTVQSLTVSSTADSSVLTLNSAGVMPTTFMKIFGVDSLPIHAHSEITRSSMGLELALVIDTTGSMSDPAGGGLTKMQAAKNAANSLIGILYGSNPTPPENLWVGLVPFAQSVNINATTHAAWAVPGTYNWGTTTWAGCVDAREASNRDVTDDPPTNPAGGPDTRFPKYYWPDDGNNNWMSTSSNGPVNTSLCSNRSTCTCANWGPCATTTTGTAPSPVVTTTISCSGSGSNRSCNRAVTTVTTNYTISGNTKGPNKTCEQQAIIPLTSTKSNLINAINALTPNGNTHVVLGTSWAYRMLSPRWRGQWGGEMNTNQLPLDYNSPLMNKAVIIMTDGDNTIDSTTWGSYWYLSAGHLGTTNSSNAVTQLNTRFSTVCNNMKSHNIIVYTIAFGTDISSTAQTLLRNCATNTDYYFYSPTGADLQTAFRTIGDSLANLRISQ